jgi:hypothetical protein
LSSGSRDRIGDGTAIGSTFSAIRSVHQHERKFARRILVLERSQTRNRGEKRLCVALRWRSKIALGRSLLDLLSPIHDDHAIGDFGDDAHVVRDEHHGHVHLILQQTDQRKYLRLNGDIERGGRLVGDQ